MADYNINAVTRRVVFTGSAGVGPYAFSFEILNNTDIVAYFNATKLTLTTDFTVTINANGTGSITLVVNSSGNVPQTPVADDQVVIVGSRDIERVTDFVTAGDLLASSLNEQLDALTIFDQQVAEENARAIRAPAFDPALVEDGGVVNMTLPTKDSRAGKTLAFDTNGNPVAGEDIGNWRGDWAASTAYGICDILRDASNYNIYRCNTAHTSSGSTPISSNADAAKWDLVIDASYAATQATNAATSATASATSATASATSATASAASATASATSETNANDWAVKVDGIVDSSDYSSKAWSIGGVGVTDTAGAGPAKDWATETTGKVDGTEYSAKEYSIGTGDNSGMNTGSAKQWAIGGGASFSTNTAVAGGVFSAKYYAEQASSTLDSFDDTYLGHKSSEPTLDNDSNALIDGALFYDTSAKKLKVYDTTDQAWTAIEAGTTNGFAIAMSIAL